MKNTLARYGHSIMAAIFLAVILSSPLCAVVGVLIPSVGIKFTGLIAAALHFA